MSLAIVVAQRNEKIKRYVEDHALPLDVLIDDSREVLRAYGVWQPDATGGASIVRPALFVIDTAGMVRYAFVAQWQHEFPAFEEVAGVVGEIGGRGSGIGGREDEQG